MFQSTSILELQWQIKLMHSQINYEQIQFGELLLLFSSDFFPSFNEAFDLIKRKVLYNILVEFEYPWN
jgi:hypothetical protein